MSAFGNPSEPASTSGEERPPLPPAPLTRAYQRVFDELANAERYRTFSVAEFYCDRQGKPDPHRVNVVVRIDVDSGFHLSVPLAKALLERGIQASHYFLTHPERYYELWGSGIPREVHQLGHEVGLHTDHYFEQLSQGIDGLAKMKADLDRLRVEIGAPVRGMVYHGHTKIDALGKCNWELARDLPSDDLGLKYHDGLLSCYADQTSRTIWRPPCDIAISDFLGFPDSWGWNYYPALPLRQLRRARPGDVVHVVIHTRNAFRYWHYWNEAYGEPKRSAESPFTFLRKSASIRFRQGLLRGKSLRRMAYSGSLAVASRVLAKGVGFFWPRPEMPEQDISWEAERDQLLGRGLDYWRGHIERLGLAAPGGDVLEVGSGNGQWLLAFARDARHVTGVEPWDAIREGSVETIAKYPELQNRITVTKAAAESLPVPDASMDVVLCAGVFMFTQQEQALAEMARVLRPGGRLCLTVNGLGYFWMYVLNGLRYKNVAKMQHGLGGICASLAKWIRGANIPGPKAVHVEEMDARLRAHGLKLQDVRFFLPQPTYPREHLGAPTNYAFTAVKEAA